MTDSDKSLPEQVLATISGEISNCFRTAGQTHSTDLGSAARSALWRRSAASAELGLSPPEDEKPPPVREVVFLPVDDEGREIQVG
jgi:hypothetical protein